MRQVFRPFSKIVKVETSDVTDTEVTLLDSSGNNLKCNYISVQVSGDATFERGRHIRIIPVIEGSLMDVSAQGAMVSIPEKLPVGIKLRILLNVNNAYHNLIGFLKWQKEWFGEYMTGVIFDEESSEQNDRIVELITQEIIEGLNKRDE